MKTQREYESALWSEYVEKNVQIEEEQKEDFLTFGLLYQRNQEFLYRMYEAVYEGERYIEDPENEISVEKEGEIWYLRTKERMFDMEEEQFKRILADTIGIFETILPLGTLVELKKEEFDGKLPIEEGVDLCVVITNRFLGGKEGTYFPYGGVVYPIGIPEGKLLCFTGRLIHQVIRKGYTDEVEDAYVYVMKRELIVQKGRRSMGFAMKEEWEAYQERKQEVISDE